jgi:hypothetical protein
MKELLARKYCFKASMKIMNRARVPVGVFFAYDVKPTIARDVEAIGTQFCLDYKDEKFECAEAELVLHNECPVELSSEIYFQPFEALNTTTISSEES